MEKIEGLIVNRAGEFVPFSEGDLNKPITVSYLERVLEHIKPNRVMYINPEKSKRDIRSLQTMIVTARKRVGVKTATFKVMIEDVEHLGFVKVQVEDRFVIV